MPDDAVALHAGVLALGNQTLWDLIVGFMSEYRLPWENSTTNTNTSSIFSKMVVPAASPEIESCCISRSQPRIQTFKLLCKVREDNPAYEHDPKLYSAKAMRCAALYNRMRILESGNLDIVRWLYERRLSITRSIVDEVAKRGHIYVLRYFYEHNARRCGHGTFNHAAYKGYLDVVKLIAANDINEMKGSSGHAIDSVARHGHLEMVEEFFVESGIKRSTVNEGGRDPMVALTKAAARNDLEFFKHLYSSLRAGESAYAVLEANALVNHCIIEFLCANQECESMNFLKQTIAKRSVSVVGKILKAVSSVPTEELADAMAFAFE